MTVFNTAYDTTACNNYRMAKVVDAVQEAQVRDYMTRADGVLYVEHNQGAQGAVPAFKHPLYISKEHVTEIQHSNEMKLNPMLAMDVRAAGRFDVSTGTFRVKNSTMYKAQCYRAALTSLWLSNGPNAFRSVAPTALAIYATWVAEAVGFRYQLDPKAKLELQIIAAIFYQSNHVEGLAFDKNLEARMLSGIATALRQNVTDVARIYDQTQAIGSIEEFCTKSRIVLDNVRLEALNKGVLVQLMGSTWGGDGATELCAVALEHPPTWIALLYEAFTNQILRKVGLAQICLRKSYKEGLENLVTGLKFMAPETTDMIQRQLGHS